MIPSAVLAAGCWAAVIALIAWGWHRTSARRREAMVVRVTPEWERAAARIREWGELEDAWDLPPREPRERQR